MTQPWEIAMKYAEAKTPFRHRGRTPRGLDCIGLLVITSYEYGNEVWDKEVYGREPWRDGLRAGLIQNCGQPVTRDLEPNDIVLMQLPGQAEAGHVGIIAPHPYGIGIIHTYAMMGKVVYHRLAEDRQQQIRDIFPWPVKD